jgi:hypothetical protein
LWIRCGCQNEEGFAATTAVNARLPRGAEVMLRAGPASFFYFFFYFFFFFFFFFFFDRSISVIDVCVGGRG